MVIEGFPMVIGGFQWLLGVIMNGYQGFIFSYQFCIDYGLCIITGLWL